MRWHEDAWEDGEESLWEERDRSHQRGVAAAAAAAAAAERTKKQQQQATGGGGSGTRRLSSISGAIDMGSAYFNFLINGRRIVAEEGLSRTAASDAVRTSGASVVGSPSLSLTGAAAGESATTAATEAMPPTAGVAAAAAAATAAAAAAAVASSPRSRSVLDTGGRDMTPEEAGKRRESGENLDPNGGSSGSSVCSGHRRSAATSSVGMDGSRSKAEGAASAGKGSGGFAEFGGVSMHEVAAGHGRLQRMGAMARRPLPMVALEIEQRLGDLFTDYRGHHPTTSMFKFVDTLNMVLAALVAGVITGIAPELNSYKAFNTALATFLVQAGFALAGTVLLPNLDMVSMLSNLGSQWFLSGASLIVVLQSIKGAAYHPDTAAQLEAGRANLAFLSALFSVAGMVLALVLKFVDVREEKREEAEAEEEGSGRQEASSLTQLIEPNPNHAALPAKTFDPHGQSDHASLSATAASAPKTKLNSSGGAEAREVARRSSTMSFSTATMLRTQQQRQQPPPFRAGDVRRGSAVAYAAGISSLRALHRTSPSFAS
ncbi:MAG: hypothetical protein WDW38_002543 [Sanguina aurantia]